MLSSLLKIEQYLKCDICLSTLRQTRIVAECGHRFCFDCISEKLIVIPTCPTCGLPAEELLKDPMHDNLVSYVSKLKTALLNHTLTPLEESLKRDLFDTQESGDLEDEYRDLPATKKFKPAEEEEERVRPARKKPQPIYVQMSDDEDMPDAVPSIVGAPYVPPPSQPSVETIQATSPSAAESDQVAVTPPPAPQDPEETKTTGETWQCPECEFQNQACVQTCGVCKNFKNRQVQVVVTPSKRKGRSTRGVQDNSVVPTIEPSTMADRSLDSATLAAAAGSSNENDKEVHIIFTGVTEKEMGLMEEQLKHVAESKLHIHVGTELKDMEKTTHVIASVDKKKQCHRTLKYLDGVVTGKWIVTPQWLLDSLKAKRWLGEIGYEVQGDAKSGITHAPEKARKRRNPLFQGMNFYFAGEFSETHNKKDLSRLLRDGGGNVESRKPAASEDPAKQAIVIYSKQITRKKLHWIEKGYQVRDPIWIINCISHFELK
ncbi:hypothetical protein INT47_011223 [Mucor saturninus]|uniref:RanBP-type and C3HC4-type zinc finger-containing protein 1 n=1 Tax=Mucor saturninus TaxID=64648 RepID=A0A8H7RKB2_9FUNG|nr:hypothetical protein INT47_011223 [Mucor saturninus]